MTRAAGKFLCFLRWAQCFTCVSFEAIIWAVESEKPLLLIGTGEEPDIPSRAILESVITARFEKPLNIKTFLAYVDSLSAGAPEVLQKQLLLVDDDPDYLKLVTLNELIARPEEFFAGASPPPSSALSRAIYPAS